VHVLGVDRREMGVESFGRITVEHLVHDGTECIQVRLATWGCPLKHLRGHVRKRSAERRRGVLVPVPKGEPEVEHDETGTATGFTSNQEISWLDVAVNKPEIV
jgi:hypothetical protein